MPWDGRVEKPSRRSPSTSRSRDRCRPSGMVSNQSPRLSRPQATAACRLGGVVKVRNWWARARAWVSPGAAQRKPTFQPVSPNIFPAEPIFTVRSRIPGRAIRGVCRPWSNTTCSQTSSQMAMASCATQNSASSSRSSRGRTTPAGLIGLFSTTSLVRGVKAASSMARSNRQWGGSRRTKRGTPPARRIRGG